MNRDSRVMMISADCHAGALSGTYNEYMPKKYHAAADAWWLEYAREMVIRRGTFFDQEASEAYDEAASGTTGRFTKQFEKEDLTDDLVLAMLKDGESAFAPRAGEVDPKIRLEELEADGVVADVIFPQMVPFGASLLQFRGDENPEHTHIGNTAYNRWLADFCEVNPGRHAGVAIIQVQDIEVAVQEVREAHALGLFGGVLLPGTTGEHYYYHHPRYEPLWQVCEELDMPLQVHGSWSPDYGDVDCATAMYVCEVDVIAHRAFTALVLGGVFERHPNLKLIFTEVGCSWILETLRRLETRCRNPIFKHFTKGLSLGPTEYFQRNCFLGASFLTAEEAADRHRVGLDRFMYGTDYPHLEGTWPNTRKFLNETFHDFPEAEIHSVLGETAAEVIGFDVDLLRAAAERVGPTVAEVRGVA